MKIKFPTFVPHLFCRNRHLQTVLPLYVPTKYNPQQGEARQIRTYDDDTIIIRENTPEHWNSGNRIVVLLHGLCGDHSSQYMMRVSAKLIDNGFKTIRVDMRGFGDSLHYSRGHMHAGRSDDVYSVFNDLARRFPESLITLIGFSLGGNIALKTVCEFEKGTAVKLDSVLAVAPPIDLLRCTLSLQKGVNRFYDSYFAKLLAKAVKRRRKSGTAFDDIPLRTFPKQIYEFDDRYTAPAAGFDSAEDYYAKCSTHQLLNRVAVPTLLLVAKDDPIVPIQIYDPIQSPYITKVVSESGGHLGFIARKSDDPDRRWMDWRIIDWVREIDRLSSDSTESIL